MGRLGTWAYEYTIARTKINPSAERRDFFTAALQSEDPKTGLRFGIKDLWVESVLLLVAGMFDLGLCYRQTSADAVLQVRTLRPRP